MQKLNRSLLLIILPIGILIITGCGLRQNDSLVNDQRILINTQREMIRLQQELITLEENIILGQSTIIAYQTDYAAVITAKLAEKDPDFAIQIQKNRWGSQLLRKGRAILGSNPPPITSRGIVQNSNYVPASHP